MFIEVLNERPEQVVMEKAKHMWTWNHFQIQESGPYHRLSGTLCHLHCCLATAAHKLDMELWTLSLTTADAKEFSSKRTSGKIPGTSNLAAWYFSAINDLWEICTIYKSKKSLASQQITQKQEGKYLTSTLDSAFLAPPRGFQADAVPQGIQNTLCPPRNSQTKTLHSLSHSQDKHIEGTSSDYMELRDTKSKKVTNDFQCTYTF